MESLESHAFIIKGHLISTSAPLPIMHSINAIIQDIQENKTRWEPERIQIRATAADQLPNPKEIAKQITTGYKSAIPGYKPAAPAQPTKKRARQRSLTDDDLPSVQARHDAGEPNGTIGATYDCCDQTIINFLKAKGTYDPQKALAARRLARLNKKDTAPADEPGSACPRPDPNAIGLPFMGSARSLPPSIAKVYAKKVKAPETAPIATKQDAFGDPLYDIPLPETAKKPDPWAGVRYDTDLKPGDLMDIHDMLAAGKSLEDIAGYYKVAKKQLEEFILSNKNARMTKIAPGYNPNIVGKKYD